MCQPIYGWPVEPGSLVHQLCALYALPDGDCFAGHPTGGVWCFVCVLRSVAAVCARHPGLLGSMGVKMELTGPVLEEEGMRVFEWWGGQHRPLEELLEESAAMRKSANP